MGAIEQIASAETFRATAVYGNTAEYRSVKRDLADVADRLTGLLGNMGIEGRAADGIDRSIAELVSNIRERADNVDQFATARNTATDGGSTAGARSEAIQPDAEYARRMIASGDEEKVIVGERLLQRLEIEAAGALRALQTRTDQAIRELPVVFPKDTPVSKGGGGGQAVNKRATATQGRQSGGYAVRPPNSATQWMSQQPSPELTPMGSGSRASISPGPAAHAVPPAPHYVPQAHVEPGAVSEQVSQPVHDGFPTANEAYSPIQTSATPATNVPFTPSEGMGLGAARAAAGAAALPAMAKAVARARSAMGPVPRGAGAVPRSGGTGSSARGASPRAGMPARGAGAASSRSGATTRAGSAAPRPGIAPRTGQGAATRAGTPARTASARGMGGARAAGTGSARGGAPVRGAASARGGAPVRGTGAAARGGTAARGATSASRAQTSSRSASTTSQGRGAPAARGGVTAPRQGAARAASGRGMMMGRPLGGSGRKKETDSRQSRDTFAAADLQEDSTLTFIEAGYRED